LLTGGIVKFLGVAAVAAAVAALLGTAGTAQAETPPGCSSTVQIGSTAYVTYGGQTIASVKQFKGCGQNWAYTYVWDQFRAKRTDYIIGTFIDAGLEPLGYQESKRGAREDWSFGTNTLSQCTRAIGNIWTTSGDLLADAATSERC
jgi:hypothetical protein